MHGKQEEKISCLSKDTSPANHVVILTDTALQMAVTLWNENRNFDSLRLYLEGKGCDGFFYGVAFDNMLPDDLLISSLGSSGLKLIVDRPSRVFIEGSVIDWIDDDRGRGFLIKNPKHAKYRGKFFKRDVWKKKLTSGTNL